MELKNLQEDYFFNFIDSHNFEPGKHLLVPNMEEWSPHNQKYMIVRLSERILYWKLIQVKHFFNLLKLRESEYRTGAEDMLYATLNNFIQQTLFCPLFWSLGGFVTFSSH